MFETFYFKAFQRTDAEGGEEGEGEAAGEAGTKTRLDTP